jgi:retron-type reverse transcriptase
LRFDRWILIKAIWYQTFGTDGFVPEAEEVERMLRQLGDELRARTYRAGDNPDQADAIDSCGASVVLRDRVVQAALAVILGPAFSHSLPCDPAPEHVVRWAAKAVNQGLTQAYAIDLDECFRACGHKEILRAVGRWIDDPSVVELMGAVLAAPGPPNDPRQRLLAPVLADILYKTVLC